MRFFRQHNRDIFYQNIGSFSVNREKKSNKNEYIFWQKSFYENRQQKTTRQMGAHHRHVLWQWLCIPCGWVSMKNNRLTAIEVVHFSLKCSIELVCLCNSLCGRPAPKEVACMRSSNYWFLSMCLYTYNIFTTLDFGWLIAGRQASINQIFIPCQIVYCLDNILTRKRFRKSQVYRFSEYTEGFFDGDFNNSKYHM